MHALPTWELVRDDRDMLILPQNTEMDEINLECLFQPEFSTIL